MLLNANDDETREMGMRLGAGEWELAEHGTGNGNASQDDDDNGLVAITLFSCLLAQLLLGHVAVVVVSSLLA